MWETQYYGQFICIREYFFVTLQQIVGFDFNQSSVKTLQNVFLINYFHRDIWKGWKLERASD